MSGRRCRALRKKFLAATGRPAIRREQRWLKKFYQAHGSMRFGLRATTPDPMSMWERAERIPATAMGNDSESVPLTTGVEVANMETV